MSWMKHKIKPMLAYSAQPFDSEKHLFEIKWDGTRCIAFVSNKIRLQNRRLQDVTYRYPEFLELHRNVKSEEAILDGEIVVLREGRPDFSRLQQREHIEDEFKIEILSKRIPAQYIVFDILYLDGEPLVRERLEERKKRLEEVIEESEKMIKSDYVLTRGREFFQKATEYGFEGIVAKELNSPYLVGERSSCWLKIKKFRSLDCVVCGYTKGEGWRREYFGSLVLGCYLEDRLVHLGQVGTGFDESFLDFFYEKLRKVETKKPPFAEKPEIAREVIWVKPLYVCEVKYMGLSKGLKLRSPVFIRLRYDKGPGECILQPSE
jgi:bifunctional non-homologous end joining protein LigD